MTMFTRRLTYGRIERIEFSITKTQLISLLNKAGEIDKGFQVQKCDFYEGGCDDQLSDRIDVVLVRETEATASAES